MIKQTMSTDIEHDSNNVRAVVNEADDGLKAVPVELVLKKDDDSTFEQVNGSNPLPTADATVLAKLDDLESKLDAILSGSTPAAVELTGSNAKKATLSVTVPVSVAAGEHKTVASLAGLPGRGVKRVSVGYRWEASIPHQAYFNFFSAAPASLITAATAGNVTAYGGVKEQNVVSDRLDFVLNNADTVARNATIVEVWEWAN